MYAGEGEPVTAAEGLMFVFEFLTYGLAQIAAEVVALQLGLILWTALFILVGMAIAIPGTITFMRYRKRRNR